MLGRFCALIAAVGLSAAAWADGPPFGMEQAAPVSAQTRAEMRTWARAFWEWKATGKTPSWITGPIFTHPEEIPENWVPFAEAYGVFGVVYQHLLQPDPRLPGYYTMDDLLRDRPDIAEAFEQYTITGVLKTSLDADEKAFAEHLTLAVSGNDGQAEATASFVEFDGEGLTSDLLVVSATTSYTGDMATIAPGTPVPTPSGPDIPDCLLEWIRRSHLGYDWSLSNPACVPKCLYQKDTNRECFLFFTTCDAKPGFDCDDFADALLAWLLHHLRGMYPDMEGYVLEHWYTNCKGEEVGHAVVYIKIGDSFYIIEPQTGKIRGPYPATSNPDPRVLMDPCTNGGGGTYKPDKPVKWRLVPPNKRLHPDEPPPWHTDPAMRQHLIDCLQRCYPNMPVNPDDYIWDPLNPGTPCTTGCGCDPAKMVPNPF